MDFARVPHIVFLVLSMDLMVLSNCFFFFCKNRIIATTATAIAFAAFATAANNIGTAFVFAILLAAVATTIAEKKGVAIYWMVSFVFYIAVIVAFFS